MNILSFLLLLLAASSDKQPPPASQDIVIVTGYLVELDCATVTAQHVVHDSRCLQDHKANLRFALLMADYTLYTFDNDSNKKAIALLPILSRDLRVTATGTRLTPPNSRNARFSVSSFTIQSANDPSPH